MNLQQALQELQALDAQNPGSWPGWVHVAASILAAVIILVGGAIYFVKPKQEELETKRQEETRLRTDFETKHRKVANFDAYKQQLADMEQSFGAMLRQLPGKSEVTNLLNDISQTRVANGLEEELFQPQGEVPKDFYAEIPNKIVLVGGYHEMGSFVSGVAGLPRIVTIDEVELKPVDAKSGKSGLRLSAQAKTYRYLDESEIRETEAAKKGAKK